MTADAATAMPAAVSRSPRVSSHLARLEEAGYVVVEKTFRGKIPLTVLRLTRSGKNAFDQYKKSMKGLLARR